MAISIADSSCSPRSSLGFLLDPVKVEPPRPKQSMWHRLGLRRWLGRDDRDFSSRSPSSSDTSPASNSRSQGADSPPPKSHDNLTRRLSRRVGVGLPRATTFKRQNSERRHRLSPVNSEPRRAASADRRTLSPQRTKSPQSIVDPRLSAPEINWREDPDPAPTKVDDPETNEETTQDSDARSEWDHHPEVTDTPDGHPVDIFDMELERRWILNLSMHFRDRTEREKFFVTYAEAANRWRRVTISCDYRDAEPESLEQDLKELRYQRDKCARIYESIRESLPDIQFYDTVTNLKLETRDGRLHVHVTEDVNEIIPYPPISSIGHLPEARLVTERRLHFEAHLSGFVYNVRLGDKSFIKKEIPGPNTVDEFLYEINALHALQGTPNVIQVEGIVVDDRQEVVKGLLISFAEKGALVDILYEYRGTISWERRERWARQIVHGLCEIHETGYVQGDFTLSNIVVDANDDAKIIDINRRGCPVGWEPPEIAAKIESNQRISMYIGVKTDLFQLGMTLWALALEEDEPERQRRPFVLDEDLPIPDYYRRLVSICLSPIPRRRLSAKELLTFFPPETGTFDQMPRMPPHTSIGVGLHNGALPLYDSRAAFPYPRGRQMGSLGHSNTESPDQRQRDSFESNPSPETDGAFVDGEEQERQTEPYNMAAQSNGVRSGGSIIFDEQSSVDDRGPATVNPPTHLEHTQGFQRSPTLDYEVSEIDLDAGVDPHYHNSSTDMTMVDVISDVKQLPDELVGVGSWKSPSRNSSIHYQSLESPVTTQAPAEIYPVDSVAESWSGQEPSQDVSTILQPALPINPGSGSLEQEASITRQDLSPSSGTSGYPQQINEQQSTNLSDSNLPINPAVKPSEEQPSEELLNQNAAFQPPPSVQSAFEWPQYSPQDPYLSDSLLPINPAARKFEVEPLTLQANNLSALHIKTYLENSQQTAQDEGPSLSESRLPINPKTESPKETFDSQADNLPTLDLKSTQISQDTIQDQNQDSFLSNSKLPINPATISSKEKFSHAIEPESAPSVQSICAQQTIRDQNQDSLLRNSELPINPATISSEETFSHTIETEAAPSAQSTCPQQSIGDANQSSFLGNSELPINPAIVSPQEISSYKVESVPAAKPTPCPQQSIRDADQSSFLGNSHLPINPAARFLGEETFNKDSSTVSTLGAQPTAYPQHTVNDLNSYLNDSGLPINPAFTDKALQFV
ncbi:hypothetical protein BJX76DRAFT_269067 [Aspergillus varians]